MNSQDSDHVTLADALEEVYGAYACVWYNQVTDKIQFVRNSQRPLWIAESDDCWFLSSEGGMLHWVLTRNDLKYKTLEMIDVDTLYTIKPGVGAPVVKEKLPEKKAPPATTNQGGAGTSTTSTDTACESTSEVSKNYSKKLGKKLQNKRVEFWVHDYVERHPFQSSANETEFLIMGEADSLSNNKHVIRGIIDITKLGILSIENIDNYFLSGVVGHTTYDARLRQLELHMRDITLVPQSATTIASNEETSTALH